ncbi:MAG: hypothetical protein U9R54_06070 [Bacteroidota bacterium]|nr:hypothetical protein [Bacteroidota bacterium]
MDNEDYNNKLKTARLLLEKNKEKLLCLFWEETSEEYCCSRALLPWIQDQEELSLKKINLKDDDFIYFKRKLGQLFGEYNEIEN